MLGLVPGIHATSGGVPWDVDPRGRPEDDGGEEKIHKLFGGRRATGR
jgi:hypothetical protein